MDGPFDYDLVCIGSGPAGQRAAVQGAKLGKRCAIIERQKCVGGICIETGTIPSKTFREAVRTFIGRPAFGRRPPRLQPSIGDLLERVAEVIERETEVIQDQLGRNGIDLVTGHAFFKDRHTVCVKSFEGTREITAHNVLVAVGSRPSPPPGVKADGRTIITSDGLMDLVSMPRSVAVVGAGVIGIEYASMFAALGQQVTIVDKRERPLEFLDHEIVDELLHQMRKNFATFRCGEGVESVEIVEGPPRRGLLRLESGKHIIADLILYSVGRVGATDDLRLDTVGLSADGRGRLSVNDAFRTTTENIYAAGDVIGYPALAATSSEQGRLAACHMFGVDAEPMGSHFPVGIYAIPEISMVGATEETLTRQKTPYETGIARFREIARGQILGDDSGMLKLIFHRDTLKLLGVHCIGSGATELIHVGQAVLGLEAGLEYFLRTVFNYPTLAECYKVATYNAANKLKAVRDAAATMA